ncbi:MAG: DUF2391 family protein [Bacteroidia bacterium]
MRILTFNISMENHGTKDKPIIKRLGGYLHKVTPLYDQAGKFVHYITHPLSVEFKARDFLQVIVGSTILAIPIAYTEESWALGEELPFINVLLLGLLSFTFVALFVYYNFYRYHFKGHEFNYIKRVIITYGTAFLLVALLLSILERCPWQTDPMLALKRITIVTFPASMSATISDTVK